MKLQLHPFLKIKEGSKCIEVRLFDEKRREIKLLDIIEFSCDAQPTETVKVQVVGLLHYQTFSDLVGDFPPRVFGHNDSDDLIKSIFSFYTKEQEATYSVLGIRIKLLE